MTKEDLASLISGREYPFYDKLTKQEIQSAEENGLAIIFPLSDDLMEFRGAIDDELGAYNGYTAYLHRKGLLAYHDEECSCSFCRYNEIKKQCAMVKLLWDDQTAWSWETDIPHALFDIMEDGKLWSQGIVIKLDDLPNIKE